MSSSSDHGGSGSSFDERSLDGWCARHGGLDSVRYISMKGETGRRQKFLSAFADLFPTKLQLVDAVDGRALDPSLVGVVDSVSWWRIKHKFPCSNYDNIYSVGAVGCAQSHRQSIAHAASVSGCTLVLESDMSAVDNEAWAKLVAEMPVLADDVDAIWFNSFSERGNAWPVEYRTMRRIQGPIGGAGAILYTPRGARTLLSVLEQSDPITTHQIDGVLGALGARYADRLNLLRVIDNVVLFPTAEMFNSSIQSHCMQYIKPMLPSSNWFYVGFLVLLLTLVGLTMSFAVRLHREARSSSARR